MNFSHPPSYNNCCDVIFEGCEFLHPCRDVFDCKSVGEVTKVGGPCWCCLIPALIYEGILYIVYSVLLFIGLLFWLCVGILLLPISPCLMVIGLILCKKYRVCCFRETLGEDFSLRKSYEYIPVIDYDEKSPLLNIN